MCRVIYLIGSMSGRDTAVARREGVRGDIFHGNSAAAALRHAIDFLTTLFRGNLYNGINFITQLLRKEPRKGPEERNVSGLDLDQTAKRARIRGNAVRRMCLFTSPTSTSCLAAFTIPICPRSC